MLSAWLLRHLDQTSFRHADYHLIFNKKCFHSKLKALKITISAFKVDSFIFEFTIDRVPFRKNYSTRMLSWIEIHCILYFRSSFFFYNFFKIFIILSDAIRMLKMIIKDLPSRINNRYFAAFNFNFLKNFHNKFYSSILHNMIQYILLYLFNKLL